MISKQESSQIETTRSHITLSKENVKVYNIDQTGVSLSHSRKKLINKISCTIYNVCEISSVSTDQVYILIPFFLNQKKSL